MNARACSSVGRPSARFIVPVLLLAAACGGETAGKGPKAPVRTAASTAASCNRGDTTATYVAYLDYIKKAVPTPQRCLKAAGTDSSVPDDGFRAMQDKGPSYFYGGDSVAQRKIREKLASVGPFASLLIVHRGMTTSPMGDTVTLRLGGHYIGGEHEGKTGASRTIVVVCADSTWKLASSTEEPPQ